MQKMDKNMQIGIFALVAFIVAYFFGTRTGKGSAASETDRQLKKDITSNQLTYDLSQYDSWADSMHQALQRLFHDESDLIETIIRKMRTKSDVLQLVRSFGKRPAWSYGVGTGSLSRWLTVRTTKDELRDFNEILAQNYIDFQF